MKTKFWHIGVASALIGTMGLAQAQTTPAAESPNSAPAIVEKPVGASGSVPGIESPTPSAPAATPSNSKDWNSGSNSNSSDMGPSQSMEQASPSVSTDASTTEGPLVGAPERGKQSSNNSDGLNVPSAYGVGGASGSAR